jgi:uncharacterized membrane protein
VNDFQSLLHNHDEQQLKKEYDKQIYNYQLLSNLENGFNGTYNLGHYQVKKSGQHRNN